MKPVKVDPGAWAHLRSDEVRSRYYDMMRPSTFVDGSGHLETFMRERDLLVLPPDPLTGLRILNKEIYGAFDYVPGFTAADSPIDARVRGFRGQTVPGNGREVECDRDSGVTHAAIAPRQTRLPARRYP